MLLLVKSEQVSNCVCCQPLFQLPMYIQSGSQQDAEQSAELDEAPTET